MTTPGQRSRATDGLGWVEPATGPATFSDPTAALTAMNGQAIAIAKVHDEHDQAIEREHGARCDLLAAIVSAVRPALPACGARVPNEWTKSSAGETFAYIGVQGLRVSGPGPQIEKRGADRGRYGGSQLYLLIDGTWLEMRYSGPWTSVANEVSRWVAEPRVLGVDDVVSEFDLDHIADAIADAMARQAQGKKSAQITKILARSERLRALATLVRSSL